MTNSQSKAVSPPCQGRKRWGGCLLRCLSQARDWADFLQLPEPTSMAEEECSRLGKEEKGQGKGGVQENVRKRGCPDSGGVPKILPSWRTCGEAPDGAPSSAHFMMRGRLSWGSAGGRPLLA